MITAAAVIGTAVVGLVIAITIISRPPRSSAGAHATGSSVGLRSGPPRSSAGAHATASPGSLRWTYTTGGPLYSRPAVAGGTVYIGNQAGKVYALDAATGHLRWAYTTGKGVYSSPVVAGGTVYAGSNDGKVYALNAGS